MAIRYTALCVYFILVNDWKEKGGCFLCKFFNYFTIQLYSYISVMFCLGISSCGLLLVIVLIKSPAFYYIHTYLHTNIHTNMHTQACVFIHIYTGLILKICITKVRLTTKCDFLHKADSFSIALKIDLQKTRMVLLEYNVCKGSNLAQLCYELILHLKVGMG